MMSPFTRSHNLIYKNTFNSLAVKKPFIANYSTDLSIILSNMTEASSFLCYEYRHGQAENTLYLYDTPRHVHIEEMLEGRFLQEKLSWEEWLSGLTALSSEPITCLHFGVLDQKMYWQHTLDQQSWDDFCDTLQQSFPGLQEIKADVANVFTDDQWATLIRHLPHLTKLQLEELGQMDLPRTFEEIGQSLVHLEVLLLAKSRGGSNNNNNNNTTTSSSTRWKRHDPCLSPKSFQRLARSMHRLSKLRSLVLWDLTTEHAQQCWSPVLTAIRSNPRLEYVRVNGGWELERKGSAHRTNPNNTVIWSVYDNHHQQHHHHCQHHHYHHSNYRMAMGETSANGAVWEVLRSRQPQPQQMHPTTLEEPTTKPFFFDKEILAALQYGPRLHQARRQYLPFLLTSSSSTALPLSSYHSSHTPYTRTPTGGKQDDASLEQWVQAILSVQDRFDCFHYLFTQMEPNVYVQPAMAYDWERHPNDSLK